MRQLDILLKRLVGYEDVAEEIRALFDARHCPKDERKVCFECEGDGIFLGRKCDLCEGSGIIRADEATHV